MLPTTTLNPIVTATATNKAKAKRGLDETVPLNWKAKLESHPQAGHVVHHINADRLWWIGLGMTGKQLECLANYDILGARKSRDHVFSAQWLL